MSDFFITSARAILQKIVMIQVWKLQIYDYRKFQMHFLEWNVLISNEI